MKRLLAALAFLVVAGVALAQVSLPWPGPVGGVPPATCTSLGSAGNTGQTTPINLTTTATVPAGSTIVVGFTFSGTNTGGTQPTNFSISDPLGNQYILIKQMTLNTGVANGNDVELWYTRTSVAMASGSVIQLNFTAAGSPFTRPISMGALYLTNATLTDTNNLTTGAATSTAPTVSTTPTQSPGIAVGFIGTNAASAPTITEPGSWTNAVRRTSDVNTVTQVVNLACLSYASAASTTYNPTSSINLNYNGAIIATFSKAPASVSACTVTGSGNTTALFRGFQRYIITSTNANAITCSSGPRPAYVCIMGGSGGSDASPSPNPADTGGTGGGGVFVLTSATGQLNGGANSITIGANGASGNPGTNTSAGLFVATGGAQGSSGQGGHAGSPALAAGGIGTLSCGNDAAGGGGGGGLAGGIGGSASCSAPGFAGSGGDGSWCLADDTQYNPGGGAGGDIQPGNAGAGTGATKAVFWEAPAPQPSIFANARVAGSGSTYTTTTTAPIVAGNVSIIFVASTVNLQPTAISDGTNSYTRANGQGGTGIFRTEVWYKLAASAVASGATITVTFGSSVAGGTGTIQGVQSPNITATDSIANGGGVFGGTCALQAPGITQMNDLVVWQHSGTGASATYASAVGQGPSYGAGTIAFTGGNASLVSAVEWVPVPRTKQTWTLGGGTGFSQTSSPSCAIISFKGN